MSVFSLASFSGSDTKLTESCFIWGGLDWYGTKIIFVSSKDNDIFDIFEISSSGGAMNNLTVSSDAEIWAKYSSDSSEIYYALFDISTYSIYKMNSDGTNKTLIKQFSEEDDLNDFILNPSETKIAYVLDEGNYGSLWIMNIDGTNSIELTKCEEWDRLDFSPDGNYIVFVTTNSHIAKINVTTKELIQLTTVYSYSPDWSPVEDKIVYRVSDYPDYGICVMNSDGSNKIKIADNGYSPLWSPDGKKILYEIWNSDTETEELYVMDSDGTSKIKIGEDADSENSVWSPDSSKIAYTDYQNIFIVNSDGTNLQNITGNTLPIMNENPCWNEDFTKIAYIAGYPDVYKLTVMDSDGSNKIELDSVDAWERIFSFYPHTTKIVYSTGSWNGNIFTINSDGTGKTQLTFDGKSVFPSWSPDLSKIAYYSYDPVNYEWYLKVMDSDGSNQITLTQATGNYLPPEWSSDGSEIAYLYGTSWDNQSIWIVNVSSPSQKTEVVSGIYGSDCGMTFSPDAQKIAYVIWWDGNNPDNKGLWVVHRDGTGKQQIYQGDMAWEKVIWAENDRIYFAADGYIYSIKPDGTDLVQESLKIAWDFDIDRTDGSNLVYNAFDIFLTSEQGTNLYYIKGYIKDSSGSGISGVTVNLSGDSSGSYTTGSSGYYQFHLSSGSYVVTPSKSNWIFSPTSRSAELFADIVDWDFTGVFTSTVSVYGYVRSTAGVAIEGTIIKLTGDTTGYVITDSAGYYSFSLSTGNYTIFPSSTGWVFSPAQVSISIIGDADIQISDFIGAYSTFTYSISGYIKENDVGLKDVKVNLTGTVTKSTTTNSNGYYEFVDLDAGDYTITPEKENYSFTPPSRSTMSLSGDIVDWDFTGNYSTPTYYIKGYVQDADGNGIDGVTVSLTGKISSSTITNSVGYYEFTDLEAGDYIMKPSKSGWSFALWSGTVNENKTVNFTGTRTEVPEEIDVPVGEDRTEVTVSVPESGKIKIIAEEKAKKGRGAINPDKNEGVAIVINPEKELSEFVGEEYKIKIFNLAGELVDELSKTPQSAEDVWIKWVPENLSSGIYIVYVEGPGVKDWKKVAILR